MKNILLNMLIRSIILLAAVVLCCIIGELIEKHSKKPIKVKYIGEVDPIEIINNGDWVDLRTAETVRVVPGDYVKIPLGVAIELPKGYEALVAPRSSTFKNYGLILANSIGIIDESYCGDNDEWNFLGYATKECVIPANTRICQFRIVKHQPGINIIPCAFLGNPDRGGIGSTGRK